MIEVDFSPETQAKLNRAAEETSSCSAEYVQRLVEHHLDDDSWFRQKVNKGLEQLDAGQFLTHEEMGNRIAKLFPA